MRNDSRQGRRFMDSAYSRAERLVGWILLATGAVLLMFDGLLEGFRALASDPNVPTAQKLAVFAVAVGIVVLLFSVFREQHFFREHERYKDVDE